MIKIIAEVENNGLPKYITCKIEDINSTKLNFNGAVLTLYSRLFESKDIELIETEKEMSLETKDTPKIILTQDGRLYLNEERSRTDFTMESYLNYLGRINNVDIFHQRYNLLHSLAQKGH